MVCFKPSLISVRFWMSFATLLEIHDIRGLAVASIMPVNKLDYLREYQRCKSKHSRVDSFQEGNRAWDGIQKYSRCGFREIPRQIRPCLRKLPGCKPGVGITPRRDGQSNRGAPGA